LRSGKNCQEALQSLGYTNAQLIDVTPNIAQTLTTENIEVAFLVLHGKYGEDGTVQGLLEMVQIPYTGNGVLASALCMNKTLCKAVLTAAGLPVLPTVALIKGDTYPTELPWGEQPTMVKPAAGGSSVGMSLVKGPIPELHAAIEKAFTEDEHVLLEPYTIGMDVTVGVLETAPDQLKVTPLLELDTKTEWYDEEAKYTQGLTNFVIPARLDELVTESIQQWAMKAHRAAQCFGVSRTDFVVTPDGQPYILEINTSPGMTDLSDLPAQAQAMGMSRDALVECILMSAQHRMSDSNAMVSA
jgi:D-alanine-D-alanine ligase